jgi:hypothetical protein
LEDIMIKTVIAAFAGTLIAAASPAVARNDVPSAASTASTVAAASTETQVPAKASKAKRYCVEDTVTGSRLPRRSCRTREEWLAEGFDPLAK